MKKKTRDEMLCTALRAMRDSDNRCERYDIWVQAEELLFGYKDMKKKKLKKELPAVYSD